MLAWQLLLWLQQGCLQAQRGARWGQQCQSCLWTRHREQGTHVSIVWMHRATFLLDPGEAECMKMRASAASLKHPPSGSTGMGRGGWKRWRKQAQKICVLEQAFPGESLFKPFLAFS